MLDNLGSQSLLGKDWEILQVSFIKYLKYSFIQQPLMMYIKEAICSTPALLSGPLGGTQSA